MERQADRENLSAMQDAAITQIAENPEHYARYLEVQGDNPLYSPGNVILAMTQNPGITTFGTKEKWRLEGRSVSDAERRNGVQIFSRGSFGKGFVVAEVYDISQTYGKEPKSIQLQDGTPEMERALATLLNYAAAPVKADEAMDTPAYYDAQSMELYVDPASTDTEAFAAIAAEVAHSRFHNKGRNAFYDRAECSIDAQSVSFLLCRRFGVECELPNLAALAESYNGWSSQEVRQALDSIQEMSKKIGGSIEQAVAPQQHTRSAAQKRTSYAR